MIINACLWHNSCRCNSFFNQFQSMCISWVRVLHPCQSQLRYDSCAQQADKIVWSKFPALQCVLFLLTRCVTWYVRWLSRTNCLQLDVWISETRSNFRSVLSGPLKLTAVFLFDCGTAFSVSLIYSFWVWCFPEEQVLHGLHQTSWLHHVNHHCSSIGEILLFVSMTSL